MMDAGLSGRPSRLPEPVTTLRFTPVQIMNSYTADAPDCALKSAFVTSRLGPASDQSLVRRLWVMSFMTDPSLACTSCKQKGI